MIVWSTQEALDYTNCRQFAPLLWLASHIPYQSKFGHTYSFKGFSLFLLFSTLSALLFYNKQLNNTYWNHAVTKDVLNKSKYISNSSKSPPFALMTALHTWHSLNQLHLECFSNSLEGVPTYAEHLLAAFPSLCGPTHHKPSHLGWGWVIVEARSSDAGLHHSPWSNSPYTAWRCVVIVLLKNKW